MRKDLGMNTDFTRLWGEWFRKTSPDLVDWTAWMRQGLRGFEQMSVLFRDAAGVDYLTKSSRECLEAWKNAQEGLKKSYAECLGFWGGVPREEHLGLTRKYEEIKEKSASQQETIKNLQVLLAESKKTENDEIAEKVQKIVQQQADHFQKLMENFGKMVKTEDTPRLQPAPRKKA